MATSSELEQIQLSMAYMQSQISGMSNHVIEPSGDDNWRILPHSIDDGSGGDIDFEDFCLGYYIDGSNLTLKAGELHHADGAIVDVGSSLQAFAAKASGDYYAFVEYTFATDSAAWGTVQTAVPVSDSDIYRVWFYKFTWNEIRIRRYGDMSIGHLGNILLPSTFAKGS
jgi:hypothetical protein